MWRSAWLWQKKPMCTFTTLPTNVISSLRQLRVGVKSWRTTCCYPGLVQTPFPGDWGRSPLHVAARLGSNERVWALLTKGADKDAFDYAEGSPLMRAVEAGHLAVVNSLLAAGADVEIQDEEGRTALVIAAEHGHIGALKALLGYGAPVNALNHNCWTALHTAADNNKAGAIDALIKAGAGIELKGLPDGLTALSCAARKSQCSAMRALLHHGANADVRNNEGNTLSHLACRDIGEGLDAAVDLLSRSGADENVVNIDGKRPRQR